MSDSNGRLKLALGGLAALIVSLGLASWTWVYVSPWDPSIPRQEATQGPEGDYQPGGAACDPKRLNALPPQKAPAERDRCASAREDHRIQQAQVREAARANDLAEGNLGLAAQQVRSALIQTEATVLAFVAAALAAVFAGIAVYHAKRSADADNDALKITREAAVAANVEATQQVERFDKQLKVATDNLSIARAAAASVDRAWLQVTTELQSGISFRDDFVSLDARVTIKNVGRGPAVGVLTHQELTPDIAKRDSEIRQLVRGRRLQAVQLGRIMFPDEEFVWRGELSMPRADFDRVLAEDVEAAKKAGRAPGVMPSIIVGAIYNLPGDANFRATYIYSQVQTRARDYVGFDGSWVDAGAGEIELVPDLVAGPIL